MTLREHYGQRYLVNYTGGVVVYVYPIHNRLPRPVRLKLTEAGGVLENVSAYWDDEHGWHFKV